jgi:acetoacetate decarboxylase
MKESDVKQRAFAMPLTSPAFPIGPYRFVNREFLIITYRTDPQKLRELVPEPLQIEEPLVKFEFIRMPDSTGFGDYTESGQVIPQGRLFALHVSRRPSADRRRPRALGLSQEARQAHAA